MGERRLNPAELDALELLPDPCVVVGPDGTVIRCTTLAARLLGRPRGEVEGQPAAEVVGLHDGTGAEWWSCVAPLDEGAFGDRVPESDLTLVTASGERPVSLTASVVRDGGVLIGLVVVLRRGERRLRLDAARSDLVSTVSHEIRSPLTSVKGFTKTLLAKWDRFNDEQKRTMLATIDEDADRVTRLLGELLDVSRIDAGRLQLRRQMVDSEEIWRKVADRVTATMAGDKIDVMLDELPRLYADPDKFAQIATNLLENAVKYGEAPVSVTAEVTDDAVHFSVTDNGPGVDPDHREAIFTKFFRKPGERRSGTGLGLYITRGLIEGHGGRIWAEVGDDGGGRFHFTLPRGGLELAGVDVGPRSIDVRR